MQARTDLCRKRFDRMDVYLVRMEKREGRDGKNKRRYLPRFIDRWTIEYVRTFAHPIDRIWRAITDPRGFSQPGSSAAQTKSNPAAMAGLAAARTS